MQKTAVPPVGGAVDHASTGQVRQHGFTLIELIIVLVLLGILAAYAAPRIFNRSDFDARGMHDMTMAYLRYAQKTAIAQRRTVCVSIGSDTLTLSVATNAGDASCPADAVLPQSGGCLPNGAANPAINTNCCNPTLPHICGPDGSHQLVRPSSKVWLKTSPSFAFNGLGQPLPNASLGLQITDQNTFIDFNRSIAIESETGYVHD